MARRWAAAALRRAGLPEPTIQQAELIVSELTTNAVVHTAGGFTVELEVDETTVRIRVIDSEPQLPEPRGGHAGAPGGIGLRLVAELSDAWGAEPLEGEGKVVWSDFGYPRGHAP